MKRALIALNVALGPTVLASYVWGARTYPDQLVPLWGGVPASIQPAYTANMFLAATGYLVFTYLFVFRADLREARFFSGRASAAVLPLAYAAILVGSIVWMPLTLYALDTGQAGLFPLIVLDLWVVAVGSLLVLGSVITLAPAPSRGLRVAAIVGALFFCLQTVVLDATVWTLAFDIPAPTTVPAPAAGEGALP